MLRFWRDTRDILSSVDDVGGHLTRNYNKFDTALHIEQWGRYQERLDKQYESLPAGTFVSPRKQRYLMQEEILFVTTLRAGSDRDGPYDYANHATYIQQRGGKFQNFLNSGSAVEASSQAGPVDFKNADTLIHYAQYFPAQQEGVAQELASGPSTELITAMLKVKKGRAANGSQDKYKVLAVMRQGKQDGPVEDGPVGRWMVRKPPPFTSGVKWLQRHKVTVTLGAIITVAAAGTGVGIGLWLNNKKTEAANKRTDDLKQANNGLVDDNKKKDKIINDYDRDKLQPLKNENDQLKYESSQKDNTINQLLRELGRAPGGQSAATTTKPVPSSPPTPASTSGISSRVSGTENNAAASKNDLASLLNGRTASVTPAAPGAKGDSTILTLAPRQPWQR